MPRNGSRTQKSGTAKLQKSIRSLAAEISPVVKYYKPTINPLPIGVGRDTTWSTKKIEIASAVDNTPTKVVTSGNIITALGGDKCDFFIDAVSVWAFNQSNQSNMHLLVTADVAGIMSENSFKRSDWGTVDRPAAVGVNIPKALAQVFNNVLPTGTTVLLKLSTLLPSVTWMTVTHLWVVYRPSD